MYVQIKHYENKLAFEMDPSDLFDALNNGEKVIALDARKLFGFEAEHIPTAIHIPHREMNEGFVRRLVCVAAERDRELPDLFDQLERRLPFLLTDHIAQNASQQANVFNERFVLVGT
jgi:hypothetical protein